MKRLLFTLASMLVGFYGMTQTISGSVKDAESGEPLYGANIILAGTRQGTISDETGHFKLANLPAGTSALRVSYLGYATVHLNVQAPVNNLEILLERSTFLTEEFIVSATRARETTPTTFLSIGKDELDK